MLTPIGVTPRADARVREERMAYVITEPCIGTKDTACVDVCPVDCIPVNPDHVESRTVLLALLAPALLAAESFLPRNRQRQIDGFPARKGIINQGYDGVLTAVPGLRPPPFEVTLETPQKAPLHLQVEAFATALQTILVEYRYLMAIAQNI
jgi:NAD-dependent dihydropyrimidine dehydrogenase PreA subunit